MKNNYRDNTREVRTQILAAFNCYKEAERFVQQIPKDLYELARLEPVDEHDFIRRPHAIADPKAEISVIKSDLRLALRNLDDAEALLKERRAEILKIL